VPKEVIAARGMLVEHLRAQFDDLSRADQAALANLSAEKLVLYLGGTAVQTSPGPRRPPAATPAADLQPISCPSPARELDRARADLERRDPATGLSQARRGLLRHHCPSSPWGAARLANGLAGPCLCDPVQPRLGPTARGASCRAASSSATWRTMQRSQD
jgi:hypothetical protein